MFFINFLLSPFFIYSDNEYPATTGTVIDAMLLIQTNHGPFA
jgi:hypothetical protein